MAIRSVRCLQRPLPSDLDSTELEGLCLEGHGLGKAGVEKAALTHANAKVGEGGEAFEQAAKVCRGETIPAAGAALLGFGEGARLLGPHGRCPHGVLFVVKTQLAPRLPQGALEAVGQACG